MACRTPQCPGGRWLPDILELAPEQERLEAWIMKEVEAGAGLYPLNAENKARYEAEKSKQ